jgi:hypothetical protein
MATPILILVSLASLTLTTAPLLFLFWLMQPATRANPGMSAYNPPLGALVGPIARRMEAGDPPRELSFATNFARDYTRSELAEDAQLDEAKVSATREARLANRKRSHVRYRPKYKQSAQAYAQAWDRHWQLRYR